MIWHLSVSSSKTCHYVYSNNLAVDVFGLQLDSSYQIVTGLTAATLGYVILLLLVLSNLFKDPIDF